MTVRVFSAGGAQPLVESVRAPFFGESGIQVEPTFGTVAALMERINAGEPCDVVILTAVLIADLERKGRVLSETTASLGRVGTGIAVRKGEPQPAISDPAQLRATLVAAAGIYVPDTRRATAGVHFSNVLRRLGIDDVVAPRMHTYPNGTAAMRALAATSGANMIGCTQITEILYTPGTTLVGPLPSGFDLATVYTIAACTGASRYALRFVEMAGGSASRELRVRSGFE